MPLELNGHFYTNFTADPDVYSDELKDCIVETMQKIEDKPADDKHPIMLLGKIQSGKTRTFEGVMSLAFDNGFDVCIVLTKGTKALTKQTYERIRQDFSQFIPGRMQVYDIMSMPSLSRFVLRQKLVFVVKKEDDNLLRLQEALLINYPELGEKRILMIDDEADFSSVGYSGKKRDVNAMRVVAQQINDIRSRLPNSTLLQVTATPYTLYLQPKDIVVRGNEFLPVKPSHTVLVPVHGEYIGGDVYFPEVEAADDEVNHADHIHISVPDNELLVLKKRDLRRLNLEQTLAAPSISVLRKAIATFIVGTVIRRIQTENEGREPEFYSFLVHTQTGRHAHDWQEEVVYNLRKAMTEAAENADPVLMQLFEEAYEDLAHSVGANGFVMPPLDAVIEGAVRALQDDFLSISKVNSDEEVLAMLDLKGQLSLSSPMNIFIGGQILDRGITISNLIGFYYGRSPKRFQQDTVLQHSRMYGFRSLEDIAVTRFYTTVDIHTAMKRMQESDVALRRRLEQGDEDPSVICIQIAADRSIMPCNPNKILLSQVTTLRPYKRLLPVGFQSGYRTHIAGAIGEIDGLIAGYQGDGDPNAPFLMPLQDVVSILRRIFSTLVFEEAGYPSNIDEMIGALTHLSQESKNEAERGHVWVFWRGDREINRFKANGRFSNAPDTPVPGRAARDVAIDTPALMLLRQIGRAEDNWRGTPFYWPVLLTPLHTKTALFANQVMEEDLAFEDNDQD